MLKTVGLESLAANDADDYLQIAVALASDLPRLSALRAGMRDRLERSALRDEHGMTRAIEAAFRSAWQDWCRTRSPTA
jgi:predicted O-linked N-acetylglucosamine transferase (SPINDLY family)